MCPRWIFIFDSDLVQINSAVIFKGQAIPACLSELIGIFKLTFWGPKNTNKQFNWKKTIPDILKGAQA
jgi:hypothetical protein